MNQEQMISETKDWLEKMVIGLDLCPFASSPFKGGRIRFTVSTANNADELYKEVLQEMDVICNTPSAEVETSLLILANTGKEFEPFLDLADLAEQLVEEAEMEDILQIASFHPDYLFADAPQDDPANYTNRSPYPMLHFIRADELENAVKGYPDPEGIPERNIELLRKMGTEEIKSLLAKPAA